MQAIRKIMYTITMEVPGPPFDWKTSYILSAKPLKEVQLIALYRKANPKEKSKFVSSFEMGITEVIDA